MSVQARGHAACGLDSCINPLHQPGWRMHAVLVEGEGGV